MISAVILQKVCVCVYGWSLRLLQDTVGGTGTDEAAPRSAWGSLLCPSRRDRDLACFSDFCLAPPHTGCAASGVFTAAFVSGDKRLLLEFAEEKEAFLCQMPGGWGILEGRPRDVPGCRQGVFGFGVPDEGGMDR